MEQTEKEWISGAAELVAKAASAGVSVMLTRRLREDGMPGADTIVTNMSPEQMAVTVQIMHNSATAALELFSGFEEEVHQQ